MRRVPLVVDEHVFGPNMVALSAAWRTGPTMASSWRELFRDAGGLVLTDTPGGRAELESLVDPSLATVVAALVQIGLGVALIDREGRGINDVYLLRVEQLYPFPAKALINELSRFKQAEIVWCQEEPKNMGAWGFIEPYLEWVLAHIGAKHKRARYAGRPAAASPATGQMSKHLSQLAAFLEEALGGPS